MYEKINKKEIKGEKVGEFNHEKFSHRICSLKSSLIYFHYFSNNFLRSRGPHIQNRETNN